MLLCITLHLNGSTCSGAAQQNTCGPPQRGAGSCLRAGRELVSACLPPAVVACPTCRSGLRNPRFVPARCLISCHGLPAAKPPRTSWAVGPNRQTIHPLRCLFTTHPDSSWSSAFVPWAAAVSPRSWAERSCWELLGLCRAEDDAANFWQYSCVCVSMWGWSFLKCGVADSQVRVVYSPFTRGKASPTLALVYFKVRVCGQAALVDHLQSVNWLSVGSVWLSVRLFYNYIKLCRFIMVHVCLKWWTCHLCTASSDCCLLRVIWKVHKVQWSRG